MLISRDPYSLTESWYNLYMKDLSYWLDTPYSPRPELLESIVTDVVIVGGGISGISAAYHCAKQGLKTILIEKETIASGSAGKNGGMVVEGFSMDFLDAVNRFGLEVAKDGWLRTVEARKTVQSLVQEHGIDCDFEQPGSLYLSSTQDEADWLREEAAARKDVGIVCELIEPGSNLRHSPFSLQLFNPADCLIHPVKFVRGLASVAEQLGVTIYENTQALKFDARSVTTPNGIITASTVVLAIESTMENLLPEQGKVIREQAIVTEPLTGKQMASLDWNIGGMFWTAGSDYINIRKIDNRLFASYGINMDPSEAELDNQMQEQINLILKFLPTLKKEDIKVSHRWTGLLLITNRSRPYVIERNGVYEIFGYGGNGLTNGMTAGKLLAEHLEGAEIPALYEFEK